MRTLVFKALAEDDALSAALGERIGAVPPEPHALALARAYLRERHARPPRVLDMFGGGGTIACEALNLGAGAWSIDINPLSVFLQRALLDYPGVAGSMDLAADVRASGVRVLERLRDESDALYPLRGASRGEAPLAYLWTYATRCGDCGFRFSLSRRPWLSRRNTRRVALRADLAGDTQSLALEEPAGEQRPPGAWRGRAPVCPRCARPQVRPDALACEDWLAALVRPARGGRKIFETGTESAGAPPALLAQCEVEALGDLDTTLPVTRFPRWSGVVNPPLYGIEEHAGIFNPRQRVTMLLLLRAILDEHRRLERAHGRARARAVTGMLSALVDQLVDWNCRLSMWISQNEQIGRAFCGPGVAMLWDYAEMDPCQHGPANLWAKLDRIVAGCRQVQGLPARARVELADATRLPFPDASFDAVVTDPPYYDNLSYGVLADCFQAWKAPLLRHLEPTLFAGRVPGQAGELVASTHACPEGQDPHERYCTRLQTALVEAGRVLAPGGTCALVFAHGALAGWEALLRALRGAGLAVHGVLPLAIERRRRPRSMSARTVNTCLAFMLRTSPPEAAPEADLAPGALAALAGGALTAGLVAAGWEAQDVAMVLFAHGVAMLANSPGTRDPGALRTRLGGLEAVVQARFPDFALSRRGPL